MSGAMNRLMAGYARAPYARVTDDQNRLLVPFEEQTPPAATPGEMPDPPTPYGSPMAPLQPPRLQGRRFIAGDEPPSFMQAEPPPRDDWTARLMSRGIRPGDPYADTAMAGAVVPRPETDPGITNVYQGNLNQSPGQIVGGWLPANATQAQQPDPRTDPAGYQNWLRVMLQRGAS